MLPVEDDEARFGTCIPTPRDISCDLNLHSVASALFLLLVLVLSTHQ